MKTVSIYRAQPILGREDSGGEPTRIELTEQIPEVRDVKEARRLFVDQGAELAAALAAALYEALPGGTLDALLMELLQRKASLFRVSFLPLPAEPKRRRRKREEESDG